jgi:hypothetical protein
LVTNPDEQPFPAETVVAYVTVNVEVEALVAVGFSTIAPEPLVPVVSTPVHCSIR